MRRGKGEREGGMGQREDGWMDGTGDGAGVSERRGGKERWGNGGKGGRERSVCLFDYEVVLF